MKGPIDFFFKLGDKVTKGDPMRQADFMYYMLWILFTAFVSMFLSNLYGLITSPSWTYAQWCLIGFAISSLQFFNLKSSHDMKKLRKNQSSEPEEKIEDVDEMLEGFKRENQVKGGNNKMLGKKKKEDKVESEQVEQIPDLVVDKEDLTPSEVTRTEVAQPEVVPSEEIQPTQESEPETEQKPAPEVEEEVQHRGRVMSGSMIGKGVYEYVIRTTKSIGEVGSIFPL